MIRQCSGGVPESLLRVLSRHAEGGSDRCSGVAGLPGSDDRGMQLRLGIQCSLNIA